MTKTTKNTREKLNLIGGVRPGSQAKGVERGFRRRRPHPFQAGGEAPPD